MYKTFYTTYETDILNIKASKEYTGCPKKKSPMFDQYPSISANMGDFFLGHPVSTILKCVLNK